MAKEKQRATHSASPGGLQSGLHAFSKQTLQESPRHFRPQRRRDAQKRRRARSCGFFTWLCREADGAQDAGQAGQAGTGDRFVGGTPTVLVRELRPPRAGCWAPSAMGLGRRKNNQTPRFRGPTFNRQSRGSCRLWTQTAGHRGERSIAATLLKSSRRTADRHHGHEFCPVGTSQQR